MDIEKEISAIKKRNKRVESDKAWETSGFRMAIVLVFTYVVAVIFMFAAGFEDPWLASGVPVLAYLISTITLPPLKEWWVRRYFK